MFGLSFGELLVLIVVAMIVLGPKDLPRTLRKLGQWAGKARRMAADLRVQSGIDDVLREGNLAQDLNEIRKLARGELGDVMGAAQTERWERERRDAPPLPVEVDGARELPKEGPDAYGALPDTALVYEDGLVKSALADDPVYTAGLPSPVAAAESVDVAPEPEPAPPGGEEEGA